MDETNENEQPVEFDAAEEFAKSFVTEDATPEKEKPSKDEVDTNEDKDNAKPTNEDANKSDDEVQDDDGEAEGEADGEDEGQDEDKSFVDSDDVFVKVKVDGEDREFAIKDLKRLAGQEASLTRKSQEVATQRKTLDDQTKAHTERLDALLKRARDRWEPYSKVNLLVAAKNLDTEQLEALQQEMQARWDDLQFVENQGVTINKEVQAKQQAEKAKSAKDCIEALSDPVTGIEGWGQQVYTDLCTFGKAEGLSAEYINDLTDPAAFKLLHKAMLYERGKQKVQVSKDKAAKSKKDKAPPKRIVKSSVSAQTNKDVLQPTKTTEAIKKLRNSGSREDAADAFMATWSDSSDA